jgi:hypothetical protein
MPIEGFSPVLNKFSVKRRGCQYEGNQNNVLRCASRVVRIFTVGSRAGN